MVSSAWSVHQRPGLCSVCDFSFLSPGSEPCPEVVVVAVEVAAGVAAAAVAAATASSLRRRPSRLCCQSINSQTTATGEKKC